MIEEYEAKLKEKNEEMARLRNTRVDKEELVMLNDLEKLNLKEEATNERSLRERLQRTNTELEDDINKCKQQYESQFFELINDNERLMKKMKLLEKEKSEHEERLQSALSDLQMKKGEVQELREMIGIASIDTANEALTQHKHFESEFITPDTPQSASSKKQPKHNFDKVRKELKICTNKELEDYEYEKMYLMCLKFIGVMNMKRRLMLLMIPLHFLWISL